MKEYLPKGIKTEKEIVPFGLVYQIIASSEYGQSMARISRYDRYRPATISIDKWRGLLGADVNGLEHLRLVFFQTQAFLAGCDDPFPGWPGKVPLEAQFSFEEQEALLLTGTVHDLGEARSGDVIYSRKTSGDEQVELKAQKVVASYLFSPEQSLLFWEKLNTAFEIANNHESKLGRAFNAVERLGYLRTGLLAWRSGQQLEADEDQPFQAIKKDRRLDFRTFPILPVPPMSEKLKLELVDNLRWLTIDVLANQIPVLIDYARTYPPVLKYLQEMKQAISEVFDLMPDSTFTKYDEADQALKKAQFEKAGSLWVGFLEEKTPFFKQLEREGEKFQQFFWRALLSELILKSLEMKESSPGEKATTQRIREMIEKEEIQFVSDFPPDEPKEPIDIFGRKLAGFEDRGFVVFFVVQKRWLEKVAESSDPQDQLDFFYQQLEIALEFVNLYKEKGYRVVLGPEYEEIAGAID